MKYNQVCIYYFSGTGNAKNAAGWILAEAEKMGIKAGLININKFEEIEYPEFVDNTLIGFCSPTHGFNLPPIMLKYIWKFKRVKNTDAFILNTRGGLKLSKLFLPGLSGIAQIFPAMLLALKGFRVVGMQPLDLPSNWLILHPALKPGVVSSIYDRCKRKVRDFSLDILGGRKRFKALYSLPVDIVLLPVAIGYYIIGRFFLAKTLIATDACNGCEKCVLQCPVRAIKMVNGLPFWTYKCESCMRCVNRCPERAIETTHSFSIALLILSSLVISPLLIALLNYSGLYELVSSSVITAKIWSLFNSFIFIMFVFLSYRILHYLMRFRLINRFIAYTSLSKYKFWRRYKAPV